MVNPFKDFGDEPKEDVKEIVIPTPPPVAEEVVEVVAPIEPKVVEEKKRPDPVVVISELDSYISERMVAQPKSLVDIELKEKTPRKQEGILALPKELEEYASKYAFRWINKHKRSIDYHLDVVGWNLVNRIYFNDLPKHLFTASGSIERGDLILGFISMKKALELRDGPIRLSQERVANLPIPRLNDDKAYKDRGENYYQPEGGSAEDDEKETPGMKVVVE